MQKIDGFYLYQVGAALQQIHDLKYDFSDGDDRGSFYSEALYVLRSTKSVLDLFLKSETYRLRTCKQKGLQLIQHIESLVKLIDQAEEKKKRLSFNDMYEVTTSLRAFEAVLSSELALLDLYIITKKGGYDISDLMLAGEVCFPRALEAKVPECIADIKAGTKCIAVSLPTAAAFHLHRANEAVLHRYWDAVTSGVERPELSSMGFYIQKLEEMDAGDKRVRSALKDLKDLHRNPLIHPGAVMESNEEAIALMNHIYTVIAYMLKEIPEPTQSAFGVLTSALSGSSGNYNKLLAIGLSANVEDNDVLETS